MANAAGSREPVITHRGRFLFYSRAAASELPLARRQDPYGQLSLSLSLSLSISLND